MNVTDFALSKEEILLKYPEGSPDYPTHGGRCPCSGCHASWTEWRAGRKSYEAFAVPRDVKIAELRAELVRLTSFVDALLRTLPPCDHHSDRPATKAFGRGGARFCDECGQGVPVVVGATSVAFLQEETRIVPDYPRAQAIRALQAARKAADS